MPQDSAAAVLAPHAVDDSLILEEWRSVVEQTPARVRDTIARFVTTHESELVDRYRNRAAADPEASIYLQSTASLDEVSNTVRRWLSDLLAGPASMSVTERIARQRLAGEALARVNYPITAVARGARKLRGWIIAGLQDSELTSAEMLQAATCVGDLLDISIELRTSAYLRDATHQSRIDEAYRMHSLGQNIAMERERQRAALMEWSHGVLVDLHRSLSAPLPRLRQSEFGLWLSHRASALFEGAPEMTRIGAAVERIDQELLPRLDPSPQRAEGTLATLVEALQAELAAIKYDVSCVFEQHIALESGRDELTRLLNRRFLSTVLNREIALCRRSGEGTFSVLILDLDHFKRINDTHGHDVGDSVLQQAASLIMASVRPSDFVFRYGGEEILVVLVESDAAVAQRVADGIRLKFESSPFTSSAGARIPVTVSIGVSQYRGRPDFQPLLTAADDALYRAKRAGRNRVEMA
jgi:diguanylate cyclase